MIIMSQFCMRALTAVFGALLILSGASLARSADEPQEGAQKPATQPNGKDDKKKIDEFAEAARLLPGPAGQPECVWVGRRVVTLLWREDLDTAFRHLELYDRFSCPAGHVQQTFRCVIRQGNIDPKAPESLNSRVHACWTNPGLPPATASTDQLPSKPGGTSNP